MIKKTRTVRETGARYVASNKREMNFSGRRFVLRHATLAQKRLLRRNVALYDKFAKHLEGEHKGEYVAIGLDGTLLVGANHAQVFRQTAEKFGAGNFALWKIGYNYELKWRRL